MELAYVYLDIVDNSYKASFGLSTILRHQEELGLRIFLYFNITFNIFIYVT